MTRFDTTFELPALHKASVGFDSMFRELERQFGNSVKTSYPPYNIIQHDENHYEIMMAVSGFSMEQLSIVQEKNVLRIEGDHLLGEKNENYVYLHKGIAERSFKREFALADHVEVKEAKLVNGMLHVDIVRVIPEELQPKYINIQHLT